MSAPVPGRKSGLFTYKVCASADCVMHASGGCRGSPKLGLCDGIVSASKFLMLVTFRLDLMCIGLKERRLNQMHEVPCRPYAFTVI